MQERVQMAARARGGMGEIVGNHLWYVCVEKRKKTLRKEEKEEGEEKQERARKQNNSARNVQMPARARWDGGGSFMVCVCWET